MDENEGRKVLWEYPIGLISLGKDGKVRIYVGDELFGVLEKEEVQNLLDGKEIENIIEITGYIYED